jgi:branched-chain amino acid transport system ATP-binding protein
MPEDEVVQAAGLELRNLSRTFGGLKAVDGVSLSVQPGERRALIGPNGAGKTTLFNLISGEIPPTAGSILFQDSDVTVLPPHQRAARGIARTFQITRLFASLTVLENMLLGCQALDPRKFTLHRPLSAFSDLTERATGLLEAFGLWAARAEAAGNLSYGDQRMLEVALSMAGRPALLLLDEPMAGLSAGERSVMLRHLERLDRAIAVLMIEHDMDVAFGFAETVTVLDQGRVLFEGSKDEVSANPAVQRIYLGVQDA